MTSSIKQRIAREWLILLAAITIGLFTTYGVFYLGRNTTWRQVIEEQSKPFDPDVYLGIKPTPAPLVRYFSKPKNPGDYRACVRVPRHDEVVLFHIRSAGDVARALF
jgi:hypothetical protein